MHYKECHAHTKPYTDHGNRRLCTFAIAYPTLGDRPLSHWALNVGMFSSATLVSTIYSASVFISPSSHRKSQLVILLSYFPALIISIITGSLWGLVGHVMETQNLGFKIAFEESGTMIYGGYSIVMLVYSCTAIYLASQRRQLTGSRVQA